MEPQTTQQQPMSAVPSNKPRAAKIAAFAVLAMAVIGAIVGGVLFTQREADNQASASALPSAQVHISAGGELSPETVQIKKGQAVTWTNIDGSMHSIAQMPGTGGSTAEGLGSNPIEENSSYTYTFEQTGTYAYYDALSSGHQAGTIIVKE